MLAAPIALTVAAALTYHAAAREREYRMLIARGDAAGRDNQTLGAIEAYSGAMALRPDAMLPHLRRGETYLRRGELDAAARDFRTATILDPTATRPLEALGDVQYQMKRFDRAAESYGRELRLDDRSTAVGYKLALARYRTGDLDAALAALDTTLRLNDRLADAHYLRGLCLRDRGQHAAAIDAFSRVIALAPGHVPAREELADLYRLGDRNGEEIDQLRRIADLERDHTARQAALALAQARAGHVETAVLTLGSALERMPGDALLYRALGQVWLDRALAEGDPEFAERAVDALGRAASTLDATSDVLTLYGRALMLAEQLDAAEQTLQQASTRYPLDPESLIWYANVAERHGRLAAGRQALIDYTGLVVDDADAVPRALRIAALSMKLNDPETAIAWLDRAARISPGDLRVIGRLADAQLHAGDRTAAQTTIARGLAIDPSNAALLALQQAASERQPD